MRLVDSDIIDTVNELAPRQRDALIEFIGVKLLDQADIDAVIAAHARQKDASAAAHH